MEKTVEIVKTARGWHVTRRYCGRTIATEFFSTVIPENIQGKKNKIKGFLEEVEQKKNSYVTAWVGA